MEPTYLEKLTLRLGRGVACLPEVFRERHAKYLISRQMDDGGFGGREGASDLYYTGFGLRALAVLGELYGEPAERAADFLRSKLGSKETIIDFLSLVYGGMLIKNAAGIDIFENASAGWETNIANSLEEFRRTDGGYAKSPDGKASSTYHTFLMMLCLQLIQQPIQNAAGIVNFLKSQQEDEGGFREIRVSKRAGTNPTAAAVGALQILNALDEDTIDGTIDFICEMQNDEGGLRANTRIPVADVLSTFTGLVTLADMGAMDELKLKPLRGFVDSLQLESGGFHAAVWDANHDVEYTFYGIGSMALLALVEDEISQT